MEHFQSLQTLVAFGEVTLQRRGSLGPEGTLLFVAGEGGVSRQLRLDCGIPHIRGSDAEFDPLERKKAGTKR